MSLMFYLFVRPNTTHPVFALKLFYCNKSLKSIMQEGIIEYYFECGKKLNEYIKYIFEYFDVVGFVF